MYKTLLTGAAAALILAAQPASAAKPILGVVELGKTPIADVQKALAKKGCGSFESDGGLKIGSGCFNLPGSPEVQLYGRDAVNAVVLSYSKGDTFEKYLGSLRKTYGKPIKLQQPFVGNKYALWKTKDVVIELEEPHMSFEGSLIYLTPDLYKSIQDANKKEQQQKKDDLDQLL